MDLRPPTLQLLARVAEHALQRPNGLAYREAADGRSLTWAALADRVEQVSQSLRSHLKSPGVVMLCAANQVEYPIAFLAVLAAGCHVFPVSADIADAELLRAVEQSCAVALIGHDCAVATIGDRVSTVLIDSLFGEGVSFDVRPRPNLLPEGETTGEPPANQSASQMTSTAASLPPRESRSEGERRSTPVREAALLLQSSGTTALPKIVRRSGRSLDAVSAAMAAACGFTAVDHVLATVPLTHSYGLEHGLLAPVWAGSTVHLCRGLDVPTVLGELSREHITIFPAVPAVFEMLAGVSDAPAITSLRTAYSAGAPLPDSVTSRFAERFGVRVAQLYGATEIGSVTFNSPHDDSPSEPFDRASVGKPMAGVLIRVLDVMSNAPLPIGEEGQVAVRADSMFDGYLHRSTERETTADSESNQGRVNDLVVLNPTAPTAISADLIDGYFITGDLGRLDTSNRLFITGRLKLLIDVGGMKVNPFEVEAVLAEHPQVAECVVVPIRQSETVSRIKAVLTARDPAHPPTGESLRAFAKARLSAYKVPRVFEVRDSLPHSATGKILRHSVE